MHVNFANIYFWRNIELNHPFVINTVAMCILIGVIICLKQLNIIGFHFGQARPYEMNVLAHRIHNL